MNLNIRGLVSGIFSTLTNPYQVPVRYRYYAEKIARGRIEKKFGYKDKLYQQGLLPRLKDAPALPFPEYAPANAWSFQKSTFGQNDYIDILGGGKLKPSKVCYEVPAWLRGRSGNEMQLLVLKRKMYAKSLYRYINPTKWHNMNKRIRYLYNFLNRRTKTGLMKD